MSESLVHLERDAPEVIIRVMLTVDRALDLYLGDLARLNYSERTRSTYARLLDKFCDRLPVDYDVSKITTDDCRRFLDTFQRRSRGTQAHAESVLSSFLKWLYFDGKIARNPMDRLPRTKRQRAEDLDVVAIDGRDVPKLLRAASSWSERLALGILCYMGPRRHAVALLRLRDFDQVHGRLRFREKGGKIVWKPIPHDLLGMLKAAIAAGVIRDPDDYLVPPEGPLQRKTERDDRVIWRLVKKVADRAAVETHVHALRAAFAVYYLEQHPGDLEALQELMGHTDPKTTRVYLRKLDRNAAMERVRDLSWNVATTDDEQALADPQTAGFALASSAGVGAGGFEPPLPDSRGPERQGDQIRVLCPRCAARVGLGLPVRCGHR